MPAVPGASMGVGPCPGSGPGGSQGVNQYFPGRGAPAAQLPAPWGRPRTVPAPPRGVGPGGGPGGGTGEGGCTELLRYPPPPCPPPTGRGPSRHRSLSALRGFPWEPARRGPPGIGGVRPHGQPPSPWAGSGGNQPSRPRDRGQPPWYPLGAGREGHISDTLVPVAPPRAPSQGQEGMLVSLWSRSGRRARGLAPGEQGVEPGGVHPLPRRYQPLPPEPGSVHTDINIHGHPPRRMTGIIW